MTDGINSLMVEILGNNSSLRERSSLVVSGWVWIILTAVIHLINTMILIPLVPSSVILRWPSRITTPFAFQWSTKDIVTVGWLVITVFFVLLLLGTFFRKKKSSLVIVAVLLTPVVLPFTFIAVTFSLLVQVGVGEFINSPPTFALWMVLVMFSVTLIAVMSPLFFIIWWGRLKKKADLKKLEEQKKKR
jgi:hypothetical protein